MVERLSDLTALRLVITRIVFPPDTSTVRRPQWFAWGAHPEFVHGSRVDGWRPDTEQFMESLYPCHRSWYREKGG